MDSRYAGNDYPRRRRRRRPGVLNHHQATLSSDNRALIHKTLESNPGFNVSQISEKTGLDRRTVRKHLGKMQDKSLVDKIGAGYFLAGGSSAELNNLVRKAIRENFLGEHNILFVRNVAGCYTIVDPDESHFMFQDLFEPKVNRFKEDGLWLDEILVYAIRYGLVSRRVYSKKEKTIDRGLLRKGWKRCFGDTRLLVFAYAISPPDFLRYLASPRGMSWATRFLETRWDSIMKEVAERPVPKTERAAFQFIKDGKAAATLRIDHR